MTNIADEKQLAPHVVPREGGIVVAYDGGAASEAALVWAAQEASLRQLPLTVVSQLIGTAAPERTVSWTTAATERKTSTQLLTATVRRLLSDSAASLEQPDGRPTEIAVVIRPVAEELLRRSRRADLLVVGVNKRPAVFNRLFESVATRVAVGSACPVLFVPQSFRSSGVSRISHYLDGSATSTDAMRWATNEAALRGLQTIAINDEQQHRWSSHLYGNFRAATRLSGASTVGSGLLVIGRRSGSAMSLGSTIRSLVSLARVPTVVVPTGWHRQEVRSRDS